jgi:hypothetical protein
MSGALAAVLCLMPAASSAQAEKEADESGEGTTKPTTDVRSERDDARRTAIGSRVGDIDAANITDAEKKVRAERMIGDARKSLARATELLQEARNAKDIVQLNCVNEKLTQIKGLLRLSEKASVQMYEAMAKGAQDVVNHEYTKIAVAGQKTQLLRTEAEQCVGELSVYTGDTEVQVEISDDIPQTDPTLPIAPPPGPGTPPVASAF